MLDCIMGLVGLVPESVLRGTPPVRQGSCGTIRDKLTLFQNTDRREVLTMYIFYNALDVVWYFSSRFNLVDI